MLRYSLFSKHGSDVQMMDLHILSFIPQSFRPGRGQTSVFRRPCERSCQSSIPVKKAGLRPPGKVASYEPDSILICRCVTVHNWTLSSPYFTTGASLSSPEPLLPSSSQAWYCASSREAPTRTCVRCTAERSKGSTPDPACNFSSETMLCSGLHSTSL